MRSADDKIQDRRISMTIDFDVGNETSICNELCDVPCSQHFLETISMKRNGIQTKASRRKKTEISRSTLCRRRRQALSQRFAQLSPEATANRT